MRRVKVYDDQSRVVARVRYNSNLGIYGNYEGYRGVTRLRDGRYVILVLWPKEGDDYGYVVSPGEALRIILRSKAAEKVLRKRQYAELFSLMLREE